MGRYLRSKKLRQVLYQSTNGKCAECGVDLEPNWHADHKIPYSITKRTNVYEMQPLCQGCNLKKGSKMEPRRHQKELTQIAREIAKHRKKTATIADVTPGGGKSAAIAFYAKELIEANVVKKVIWMCPRKTLVNQAKEAFKDWSGLDPNKYLLAEHYGQFDLEKLKQLCEAYPTLLVPDELQFLTECDRGSWSRRVKELWDSFSSQNLGLSGTLSRSDSKKLLGVTYRDGSEIAGDEYKAGKEYPVADVQYTLRHALSDCAVAPFNIPEWEGRAWLKDESRWLNLSDKESEEYGNILKEFLQREEVWQHVVDECVCSWKEHRKQFYPSKAIFIATTQDHARQISRYLRKRHSVSSFTAISDNDDSHSMIDMFRGRKYDSHEKAMVTVAMASVGLDTPDASHQAYLSHYRAWGWVLQAWARVSRIDYKCGVPIHHQVAHIHTIRDPKMDRIIEWIKSQIPKGIREPGEGPPPPGPGDYTVKSSLIDNAEITGIQYETSDLGQGVVNEAAIAVKEAIAVIPALSNIHAKVAATVVPYLDLSKCEPIEPREPSLDEIEGSEATKAEALSKIIQIALNKICHETGEDHDHARTNLRKRHNVEDVEWKRIKKEKSDVLVNMVKELCETLEYGSVSTLYSYYTPKKEWDPEKREQKIQYRRELTVLMDDILSVLKIGINIQFKLKGAK